VLSPGSGTYDSPLQVTIADSTPGATIYYTIDGSTPTTSSTQYTGPVTLTTTGTIKAIATAPSLTASAVATATYTITQPGATATLSFTRKTLVAGANPITLAVDDFNGDGKKDLVVANEGSNNVAVFLGNGDGSFQAPQFFAVDRNPVWVAAGDFDGDGRPDLAVANINANNVSMLLNNGDGTFRSVATIPVGTQPTSLAVGNFDSDQLLDLAVANWASFGSPNPSDITVLLGNGLGSVRATRSVPVGVNPIFPVVADFNGDGVPDLAVANFGNNNVTVLLGNGDGTFRSGSLLGPVSSPYSVAVGHFIGDGKLDLAVANFDEKNFGPSTVSVLLNNTGAPAPDYTLSASPGSVTVTQGSSATSTISISPLNGFTGSVNLSTSLLPSGVTAAFSPNPTATTSTLTLTANSTAPTGTVTVTITGNANALTQTTTLSLTV